MTDKTTITLTEKDGVVTATFSGAEAKEHVELLRQHWKGVNHGLICRIEDSNTATFKSNDREQPTNAPAVETILSNLGKGASAVKKLAAISEDLIATPERGKK